MINTMSDYALNKKDAEAIIYMDAEGKITRLSRDSFSSEEEFLYWKSWSDANYHSIEKENHLYANHTLSLDLLSEGALAAPPEETLVDAAQEQVEQQLFAAKCLYQMRIVLTETQYRRLCLYYIRGLTVRDIALRETVSFQCVHRSIQSAQKKYLNSLRKWVTILPKIGDK